MTKSRRHSNWRRAGRMVSFVLAAVGLAAPSALAAGPQGEVTFTKDIAPILQRSCQRCHRPDSIAPMSLITYEQVRPFARDIKRRTSLREMPPWYIEKNIGIQKFKNDPSLSDEEIAKVASWVDSGAPQGNPADMPPPLTFGDAAVWALGKPDLIISSPSVTMEATAPDWWGGIADSPTGLTEDRYVSSFETREVNDIPRAKGATANTVGALWVFHHAVVSFVAPDAPDLTPDEIRRDRAAASSGFPAHEVGRNGDVFDAEAGRLVKAGSVLSFDNMHLHANGRRTKAHLDVGLKFHPKGYQPKLNIRSISFGLTYLDYNGNESNQRTDAYYTLPAPAKLLNFEPHMHAPGVRMCLEAIWGSTVQTLNCAGYNHSWVRNYQYTDDSAPLLPKGTVLHVIGWADTTAKNPRVVDPRNWSGWGRRSIDNMFLSLSHAAFFTDEQFKDEVAKRREKLRLGQGEIIGCPLCATAETPVKTTADNR
jgi:hypothetical protein